MAQVEIYTARYCSYCHSAKALLTRIGIPFTEIDVTGDREGRDKMVERARGRYTVPQIFIGSTHVGGAEELHRLQRAGKLDAMLAAAGISQLAAE
jgi:glutaredoxin 3